MKFGSSLTLLLLAALGGALYFTNPTEAQYADYLSSTMTTEAKVSLCQPEGFSEWLGKIGEALSGACQSLLSSGETLSQEQIRALIASNTEYNNRILFSTYKTITPFGNYEAIGAFNRFFLTGTQR